MKKDSRNLSAVPDVPADNPVGTMDRFTRGLRRVLAAQKQPQTQSRTSGRTAAKRKRLGISQSRSMIGKTAVMGLLERNSGASKVRTQVIMNRKKNQLEQVVCEHVEVGSALYTDQLRSYDRMGSRGYVHQVIDHAECYVNGAVHTNGLENFWSLLKRAIKGTYVSIEPFHLFRYLDEQAFRFNEREGDDHGRFVLALKGIINKRLTYKALIGSELPQTC